MDSPLCSIEAEADSPWDLAAVIIEDDAHQLVPVALHEGSPGDQLLPGEKVQPRQIQRGEAENISSAFIALSFKQEIHYMVQALLFLLRVFENPLFPSPVIMTSMGNINSAATRF